ncbi:hypothetical protein JBE27_57070 [Streptomyces albiflaviniger]|nr:hypothetical protein [Streptomyces albiflaviniger]
MVQVPRYTVKVSATSPSLPAGHFILPEYLRDKVEAVIEPTSSELMGAVAFEELTSFLVVSRRYLTGYAPSKELTFRFHIDMIDMKTYL